MAELTSYMFVEQPPAFACYKTSPHWNPGLVRYTTCNIRTDDMNPATGVFTVKRPGVYRLSFTGLFNAENGHRVTADIVRKRSGRLDFLGRSSAETNEAGAVFGELVTPCVNETKPRKNV